MRVTLIVLLLLAASLFSAQSLKAGSFQVLPMRLFLTGTANSTTLELRNQGDGKAPVQLEVMQWKQNAKGEDVYQPTKDIIFFPKIFTIEPGEEIIVRLSYQGTKGDQENTYRLFINELPVSIAGKNEIQMPLQIGIPIFIGPLRDMVQPQLQKVEVSEGKVQVHIHNAGNRHVMINKIEVEGTDASSGGLVFQKSVTGWYVLQGASKTFVIDVSQEACSQAGRVKVIVHAGELILQDTLQIEGSQCLGK